MISSVRIAKRMMDVVGSAVGLAAFAPLLPILGTAIYFDSPGPILYRQRRAGRITGYSAQGSAKAPMFVQFDMFKFRTMRVDAEKLTGPVLAAEHDPRVTRIGRFLRRTRLDELPQLWNVLVGDMSIVGPRPERPELMANLALAIPFFEERMRDIKPGITGLAQISLGYTGRAPDGSAIAALEETLTNPFQLEETQGAVADDMRIKLLFDLAYVAALESFETFLRTDLEIIFKTPLTMLRGEGR